MKIRTQFIITMLLFGMILILLVGSAIVVNQLAQKANEQEKIASSIAEGANELSYLGNDYLVYRENPQLKRWQTRFDSLSNLVARLSPHKPEQQAIIRNIQANQRRLKEVFDSVASNVERPSQNQSAALDPAFFQVSWSRMAVQSQALLSDASRMSQLLHQQTDRLREIRTILIYVMVGLFGLLVFVSYMQTYRRILRSLATLRAGTAVIGSGNLDFKIEEKKNDEIGDLSRAFNRMTANLKDVTASKSELEREIAERKQAEEALRQANERAIWLSRFPEQNPNPVMRSSADGIVLYCNPASAKFPGWRCEVGQLLQKELLPLISQAMAEGKELQWDIQIEGRYYFIWIAPFSEEGYLNIYARDITERKKAEEKLLETTRRFQTIVDNAPIAIYVKSRNGRFVFGNRRLERYTGHPLERLLGMTDYDFAPKKDADRWRENDLKVLEGRRAELEETGIDRDGRPYVNISVKFPLSDESGTPVEVCGISMDITERKRMEEELRQLEEKSRLLIKYAPSMFYEIDFRGPAFISVNDTMCQFLGYSREELLAMNPFDLLDNEGKALFRERIRRKFAGEDISDSVEYKSKTKDGREVYGVLNMTFTYKDGKLEGAVVVAHDITERKRAEVALRRRTFELQQLTERLEQRVQERTEDLARTNEALRQLSSRLLSAQEEERKRIAGELHDTIGACLSGIKFKVEDTLQQMEKKAGVETKSLKTIVPVIREAIEDCRRIQMDLRPSMLDDLGLLPALAWFCRRFQTIYSGIRVEQEMFIEESQIPNSLKIVIYRITQEAMNNIAKHSKADLVHLVLRKIDGRINVMVEDNGRGFNLEKVLGSENTSRGLGLTNMRERIELSGGSFEMQSTEGKGTIIRAWWPI